MEKKSSIIDVPRKYNQEDLFGIEKYQIGLQQFIRNADTPLTVALQGEWGSGKTSLMNLLKNVLCDGDNSPFYGIWINTWQYSLLTSPEHTLLKIISGLTDEIISILKDKHQTNIDGLASKAGKFLKKASLEIAKFGADKVISGSGNIIQSMASNDDKDVLLNEFRDELQKAIHGLLEKEKAKGSTKKGILFFIDDLDRIDPPVAVQILELLKNIFDLENCIFILAIDYDVVIKGLKPKFGELTESNEREFRSFFDKIIQLPFSMPVASYQIEKFLNTAMKSIDFMPDSEDVSSETTRKLAEFAGLSVGTNPRALKRLTNTLSLISLINKSEKFDTEPSEDEQIDSSDDIEKLINFALVCMQIAYPYVYNNLISDPDFTSWNEAKASKMKLEKLTDDQKKLLDNTTEFDDAWEKVLFQMCQKDSYSSNRVFQISQLLNRIKELIPENENLGEYVAQVLELSSITNLIPNDGQKVITGSRSVMQGGIKQYLLSNLPQSLKSPLINEIKILQKGENSRMEIRTGANKKQLSSWWAHPLYLLVKQENSKTKIEFTTIFQRWSKRLIGDELPSDVKNKIEVVQKSYNGNIKSCFGFDIETLIEMNNQKDKLVLKIIVPITFSSNTLSEEILKSINDFISSITLTNYELSLSLNEN